jgi:hypothetical protein
MDGNELFDRVVSTVQETNLKIGDMFGSISLYYPFEGDYSGLLEDFREASKDFPDMIVEQLFQRIRIIVSEEDSRRISELPVRDTIRDMVELTKRHLPSEEFMIGLLERHPEARFVRSKYPDFDWILMFPSGTDDDIYCLTEELGQVTYHRYSRDEFLKFGFEIP